MVLSRQKELCCLHSDAARFTKPSVRFSLCRKFARLILEVNTEGDHKIPIHSLSWVSFDHTLVLCVVPKLTWRFARGSEFNTLMAHLDWRFSGPCFFVKLIPPRELSIRSLEEQAWLLQERLEHDRLYQFKFHAHNCAHECLQTHFTAARTTATHGSHCKLYPDDQGVRLAPTVREDSLLHIACRRDNARCQRLPYLAGDCPHDVRCADGHAKPEQTKRQLDCWRAFRLLGA